MQRWVLGAVVCVVALAAWLAFGPLPGWTEAGSAMDGDAGSVAAHGAAPASASDRGGEARNLVGPEAPAPIDPELELQRLACVDDETVLAPDVHRMDHDKPTTRVDPRNLRVVYASPVALRKGPRLSAEFQARLQLELRERQIFVLHETSTGKTFFAEVPDKAPAGTKVEPSLYEVYRLRTGHTLAISFEPDGALESVAYGEPNEEAVDIPAASEAQMLALFGPPSEAPPPLLAFREEQWAYQPRIVCSVCERVRVKSSGELETARMTVECIAGPSTNTTEFFILPLTP